MDNDPLTLPANMAVAVHPREKYAKVKFNNSYYWVGESLVDHFIRTCKLEQAEVVITIEGKDLAGKICQHPFIERKSRVLEAEYVTMDSGTGCVHIAPGHGLDDYLTGLEHGIEVYCPLDDNGCYIKDEFMPDELVGLSVLEKANGCAANQKVLEILREKTDSWQRRIIITNTHIVGEVKHRSFSCNGSVVCFVG